MSRIFSHNIKDNLAIRSMPRCLLFSGYMMAVSLLWTTPALSEFSDPPYLPEDFPLSSFSAEAINAISDRLNFHLSAITSGEVEQVLATLPASLIECTAQSAAVPISFMERQLRRSLTQSLGRAKITQAKIDLERSELHLGTNGETILIIPYRAHLTEIENGQEKALIVHSRMLIFRPESEWISVELAANSTLEQLKNCFPELNDIEFAVPHVEIVEAD